LNAERIISETKKSELTEESKSCKKKFDGETGQLKKLTE